MSLLPKSRKARRRLMILAVAAPVLALSVGLGLYGLRGSISLFYTPSQARDAQVPAGRKIQLGGIVETGSVRRPTPDRADFVVADARAATRVAYSGVLPDLFREGQGVVLQGAFEAGGGFVATEVLAKHDERYAPRQLTRALKQVQNGSEPRS